MTNETTPRELRNIERAASRIQADRQNLHALIREARDAGYPLRTIAACAGLSHEHVRRIAP